MFGLSQNEKNADLRQALDYYSGEKLLKALKRGADPNHQTYRFSGSLFAVVGMYDEDDALDAVKKLIEHKADVNLKNDSGDNALAYMADRGRQNLPVAKALIAAGIDIRSESKYGTTPLTRALRGKLWKLSKLLIENDAHKVEERRQRYAIASAAAANGAPMEVFKPLLQNGLDVNFTPGRDVPLLVLAVANGHREHADFILAQPGVKVDATDSEGSTALLKAVARSDAKMVEALLAAKAQLDQMNKEKQTPLVLAAENGNQEIVERLIKAGARLGLAGGGQKLALTHAAEKGLIPMVMTILAAAKEQDVKLELIPALDAAADKGHGRIVELLVQAGADVNAADKDGRTPLMRAALSDQVETLSILIKAGADPAKTDRHGMQAYDHAVSRSKDKAKEYLARYRSDKARHAALPQEGETSLPVGDYDAVRLNDHSLEVREGDTLTMTFNFWTQQVILRDLSQPSPPVVQNFAQVQRQEAIREAFDKLVALGGNPPDPSVTSMTKKQLPGPSRG